MSKNKNWQQVCQMDEIPRQGSRTLETKQGVIAVFRTDKDRVYAIDNKCPHKGGPLADGIVFADTVACPLHNWCMSLKTGQAIAPDEGQVVTYPCKIEDGTIYIQL